MAQIKRHSVTVPRAVALGREGNGEIALLRSIPQIVMAHQPVEVERRSGAGIGVDRDYLRQGSNYV